MNPAGELRTLYEFLMVQDYSRQINIEFVKRCTTTVFLDCHQNASRFLGGVTAEILYDNMKNIVARRHGSNDYVATVIQKN